jgi:hypothetical protein
MVATRIALLCGCSLALGGCLSPTAQTGSYTALSPVAVANVAVQPVIEPGQLRDPELGRVAGGVNPSDDLRSSERARAAWRVQRPSELALPPSFAAHSANAAQVTDPVRTASVSVPAKGRARRDIEAPAYNANEAMDRLEAKGQKVTPPICSGC